MTPPAPHHPPPAPDWILGDDGHWKPPPFGGGSGDPRPAPGAPPPGPGGGRGERRSVSRWLGMPRRDVVWGVIGLVMIGVGTILEVQGTGPADVVMGVLGEEDAPSGPPTVEESMDARARTVLGPDGDVVCPSVERVSDLMNDDIVLPTEIVRQGVEWSVNDIDLAGIECRYGDGVRLGKLDGFEDRVHPLREGGGPVVDGPFPGSVRIDDPEAGTATIVFEDRDETMEAFVTLPLDQEGYFESLAFAALN